MKIDVTFSEKEQSFPVDMGEVMIPQNRQNGATFFPSVSEGGTISWTNDRELENPPPVNIRGGKGDDGLTPYIGENGNWWIGDEDTGVLAEAQGGDMGNIIDVIALPTSDIDTKATYRVLNDTFVLDKMLRNDSTCHIVEWDSVPTEPGESVLRIIDGVFSYVGYYNVKNNTVYGYFGNDTIEFLLAWVENSSLNFLVKMTLKAYLQSMTAGWKTMQEIVSAVGTALSMSWGGVITSIEDADNVNKLYLYLSSRMFFYQNGVWVGMNAGVCMPGTGIGAVVFNHPDNTAPGMAARAGGRGTNALGDNSSTGGFGTFARGLNANADGDGTEADGPNANSHGEKTKAKGKNATSNGCLTEANGDHSSSRGYNTKANASASSADGIGTIADGEAQAVFGKYNIADAVSIFIIGNGTQSTRSNAMAVDWNGNAEFAGNITSNGSPVLTVNHIEYICTRGRGITSGPEQTVAGRYNREDHTKAFIVGNGYDGKWPTDSNAHTIDWDGNAWFSGDIKIGGTGQDDEKAQTVATQEFVRACIEEAIAKLLGNG